MIATEEERHLLGLVLPRVENVIRLMRSEGIEHPAEAFRVLLRLDPDHPPAIPAAKYLPIVGMLRGVFRFGGNDVRLEAAMVRAADLTAGLL